MNATMKRRKRPTPKTTSILLLCCLIYMHSSSCNSIVNCFQFIAQQQQQRQQRHNALQQDQDNQPIPSFTLKQRNPYDVHVYYDGNNEQERAEAMELRNKMQQKFAHFMRFYPPKDRPIGPHPKPMWEADFGGYEHRHMFPKVRDFIQAEHGALSVLIHPHSLDGDYHDHTKNAFWAGPILKLRIQGW